MPPQVERARRPVFTNGVEADAGLESAAAAALAAWRHKAAEILLAATAAVHLPPAVLFVLGHGPPFGSRIRAIAGAAYLVMLASTILRRVDYRKRLWAYFIAAYVIVILANLWDDRGPYAQIGLERYLEQRCRRYRRPSWPRPGCVLLDLGRCAVLRCHVVDLYVHTHILRQLRPAHDTLLRRERCRSRAGGPAHAASPEFLPSRGCKTRRNPVPPTLTVICTPWPRFTRSWTTAIR